jgi:hypothetical protein
MHRLPQEIRKTLIKQGITTMKQLLHCDGLEMLQWKHAPEGYHAELLQALLAINIRPAWMRTVASRLNRPTAEQPLPGWTQVMEGCTKPDAWMLEVCIAQLNAGGIKWMLVAGAEGTELWRAGGKEVEA